MQSDSLLGEGGDWEEGVSVWLGVDPIRVVPCSEKDSRLPPGCRFGKKVGPSLRVVYPEGEGPGSCIPALGTIYTRRMQSDSIMHMSKQHLQEKVKEFTVFEIENVNKKSKNYKKKIFISSSSMTEETILSRIRSMQDSKTGRGGTKELSKDIKSAGEGYDGKFKVRVVKSSLSRERAEELKARLIDKQSKVYNQSEKVI